MVNVYNLKSCLFIIKAQTLKAIKRSPDPSYVSLGDTLILNVTYTYSGTDSRVGVTWRHSKTKLYEKGRLGGVDIPESRASLLGQATLVLHNTELDDNGTYSVNFIPAIGDDVFQIFTVFIKGKHFIEPKIDKNNLHQLLRNRGWVIIITILYYITILF